MSNGNISHDMVIAQADRAIALVEQGEYDKCPVPGQREVQLFQVTALKAILVNQKSRTDTTTVGTVTTTTNSVDYKGFKARGQMLIPVGIGAGISLVVVSTLYVVLKFLVK